MPVTQSWRYIAEPELVRLSSCCDLKEAGRGVSVLRQRVCVRRTGNKPCNWQRTRRVPTRKSNIASDGPVTIVVVDRLCQPVQMSRVTAKRTNASGLKDSISVWAQLKGSVSLEMLRLSLAKNKLELKCFNLKLRPLNCRLF